MSARLLLAVVLSAALSALAEPQVTLRVAYCPETDTMGPMSAYAGDILKEIATHYGWRLCPVGTAAEADIIASAFVSRELKRDFEIVRAPLGQLTVSLFARPELADSLAATSPFRWPRTRIAWMPGILNSIDIFREWNIRNLAPVDEFRFPDFASAMQSVTNGTCQLLLRAGFTTPAGLVKVQDLGTRPCFISVRKSLPGIYRQMVREFERLNLHRPELFDTLRLRCFGTKPSSRRVRVGRYLEPGFCDMLEDGSFVGANIDYIERIAEYGNWEVEWVTADYDRLIECVEDGRIDVLAGVSASDTRIRKGLLPRLSCGMCCTYLFARRASLYEKGGFEGWKGAVVGTGLGEVANAGLREYLQENHVNCEIREYDSTSEAIRGYFRGECQIIHSVGLHHLAAERIIHTFPQAPAYIVVTSERKDVFADVEKGLSKINTDTPGFDEKVASRHFLARGDNSFYLTSAERRYLRHRITAGKPIVVEISPEVDLLKEWDYELGEADGFIKAVVNELSRRVGVNFYFLPPADAETVRERYERGEFDLWVASDADIAGLPLRYEPVETMTLSRVLVCRRTATFSRHLPDRVAVSKQDYERFRDGRTASIAGMLVYDRLADCFQAVLEGKADCTMCTSSRALTLIRELDKDGVLEIRPIGERIDRVPFPFLFSPRCDPELVSIVSKALASFDRDDIDSCMSGTLSDFARDELPTSIWIIPLVFAVIGTLLLISGILVSHRAQAVQATAEFRERAANARSELLASNLRSLTTSTEIISSRAEFLRNPDARREQSLDWTADILHQAENMLMRFEAFRNEAAGHEEKSSKLHKIQGGAQ